MATLPIEQVLQSNKTNDVSIVFDSRFDSPGEKLWLATFTPPQTVVATKSVVSDQLVWQTMVDRINAAGAAAYDDYDIFASGNGGVLTNPNPLATVGDGTETLAAANSVVTTKDIAPYVAGGRTPYSYAIGAASVIDLTGASAAMAGSILEYTSGAVDGTDVVVVEVTDGFGDMVTVEVTVTVA